MPRFHFSKVVIDKCQDILEIVHFCKISLEGIYVSLPFGSYIRDPVRGIFLAIKEALYLEELKNNKIENLQW